MLNTFNNFSFLVSANARLDSDTSFVLTDGFRRTAVVKKRIELKLFTVFLLEIFILLVFVTNSAQ